MSTRTKPEAEPAMPDPVTAELEDRAEQIDVEMERQIAAQLHRAGQLGSEGVVLEIDRTGTRAAEVPLEPDTAVMVLGSGMELTKIVPYANGTRMFVVKPRSV